MRGFEKTFFPVSRFSSKYLHLINLLFSKAYFRLRSPLPLDRFAEMGGRYGKNHCVFAELGGIAKVIAYLYLFSRCVYMLYRRALHQDGILIGSWQACEGEALRICVSPHGSVFVVSVRGAIYQRDFRGTAEVCVFRLQ